MKIFKTTLFPAVIFTAMSLGSSVDAATVVHSTSQYGGAVATDATETTEATTGSLEISVFGGNSYINGEVAQTALSGVVDYAFFHDSLATASLSGSSTVLPVSVSNSAASSSSSRQDINFYTTNDPAALTPTPNATFDQHTVGTNNTLTGTFNFSALPRGTSNPVTVYLIHGGWVNFRNFTLTDGVDNWNHAIALGGSRQEEYVTEITISDFSLSDSFTYTLSGSNNNPTFIGAIVTQVPESSSSLLVALGALGLTLRRRRN